MNYYIKFGDITNAISVNNKQSIFLEDFGDVIFLNQIHSNLGKIIYNKQESFLESGDYLFTNQQNMSIGVLTADCLPIIIIDKVKNACSAVHAGWRGSVNNITINATNKFLINGSKLQDLIYYFGPCIGVCCYEVSKDFIGNLKYFTTLKYIDQKIYFDLLEYNTILLIQLGVKYNQINLENWQCTFCSKNYYSYRKNSETKMRQFSIVKIL